jgi:TnpA family transposase
MKAKTITEQIEAIEKSHAEGKLTDEKASLLLRDVERIAKMAELKASVEERVKIQKAINVIKNLIVKFVGAI